LKKSKGPQRTQRMRRRATQYLVLVLDGLFSFFAFFAFFADSVLLLNRRLAEARAG